MLKKSIRSVFCVITATAALTFGFTVNAVPNGWGSEPYIPCGWNNHGEPTSESCTTDDDGFVSCARPEDCFKPKLNE